MTPEQRRERMLGTWLGRMAMKKGYSQRANDRLRAAIKAAAPDPLAAYRLVNTFKNDDAHLRLGRRRGRPAKSGLW
jgi:hypothetical protein